jgi:hypothetical protein
VLSWKEGLLDEKRSMRFECASQLFGKSLVHTAVEVSEGFSDLATWPGFVAPAN